MSGENGEGRREPSGTTDRPSSTGRTEGPRRGGRGPRDLHGGRPHVGELPVREDVEREVRAHLEMAEEDLVAAGWEPTTAREEARRRFGDERRIREECEALARSRDREVRRAQRWEGWMQDVRYAIRTLAGSPVFTGVALVTLALGIGANTAVFSVVKGVLLDPLPYPEPHELVTVDELRNDGGTMAVAWPNFTDWAERSRSFQALAAYGAWPTTLVGGGEPARVPAASVSQGFWQVMRPRLVEGRTTLPEEHVEGAPPRMVVSQSLAERHFGAESVVGRTVEVAGALAEIVGVVETGFDFPGGAEIWYPVEVSGINRSRTSHNHRVVARLRPEVTPEAAWREMDELTRQIVEEGRGPDDSDDYLAAGAVVTPLHDRVVGSARQPLYTLFGAAAFVLLVACTNLASTLLARGTARSGEIAVRSSLGAARGRLVRQLLTESGVLAALGSVLGVGVAFLLVHLMGRMAGASVPRAEGITVDAWALVFALAVGALTTLLFGLVPALRLTEEGRAEALGSAGRGAPGRRSRVWGLLVGTEVALALVLLVGAGLLVRSLDQLASQELAFDADDVLTASVSLSALRHPDEDAHRAFWDDVLPRLEASPEVSAAGIISTLPLQGSVPNGRLELDGSPDLWTDAAYVVASPGAFEALDIPLVRGRTYTDAEGPDDGHVAVVSESFAQENWPGEDPVGRLVSGGGMDRFWSADPPVFATVVGVVKDVRFRALDRSGGPTVYFSARQRPGRLQYSSRLVVEAERGGPADLGPLVRGALQEADPTIPVELDTMVRRVRAMMAERRFVLTILGGFSLVALFLAAVGIYGVVGYSVEQRTREIGVRLALGASPGGVQGDVVLRSLRPVLPGVALGVLGALLLTRLLQGLLFGVSATDPFTFAAVAGLLVSVAALAGWLPARRVTRVSPTVAMRGE